MASQFCSKLDIPLGRVREKSLNDTGPLLVAGEVPLRNQSITEREPEAGGSLIAITPYLEAC